MKFKYNWDVLGMVFTGTQLYQSISRFTEDSALLLNMKYSTFEILNCFLGRQLLNKRKSENQYMT